VFFDNVRIPRDSILGGLNNGWRMAMATLVHERGIYTLRRQTEMRVALDELTRQATEISDGGQRLLDNPVWRRRLGRCEAMVEMMAAQGYRTAERAATGDAPAESSVDKVLLANVEHEVLGFALDLLGSFATVAHTGSLDRERWLNDYFFCRTASIYGGTGEIQRNIIATSILELPRT
jgi:alkylation response protein AidB-like acyl-CoA dehydrogenase